MKRILPVTILVLLAFAICVAGCISSPSAPDQKSSADTLITQAEKEFQNSNLHAAESLFRLAQQNYTTAGNTASAKAARDQVMKIQMMTFHYPYNRSAMDRQLTETFPDLSAAQQVALLDDPGAVTLKSDGETWYFEDTVSNIVYHNMTIMQKANAGKQYTPFYDELAPLAFAPQRENTARYSNPVTWEGTEEIAIPRDRLPGNGTLKLWVPLPVEYGPQQDVTITTLEPAQYLQTSTVTGTDIGLAYFEIPLAEVRDPFVNITARFLFTEYTQRFTVDPAKVLRYNTSDPEYRKYTAPSANIAITPAMKKKALEIVRNETNPYLQVQKIYRYVSDTLPYSHAPHMQLEATGKPRSEYVLETGIGDCGAQSQYFAALCRAVGIPARVPAGYQMILGPAGTHVWAEYYVEGYGWIPADVTVAEGADWSYNATTAEREQYRDFFSRNLDPYRYVIQKDVDIPLSPEPGADEVVIDRSILQIPVAVCDTCTENPSIMIPEKYWAVSVARA
ncbi:transglutaminase-like domain-containing protein [Methanoregula sp.]|uniref:transglutaminase-like domain-containing protein n=1 Tax=Methanoregula sp. TaxID=2052170 RepID=UPI002619DAC9|nr:transglutaminase-like domain-containing protein [Methanoregula sp.]MDD5142354.1 transglutaminase-like domain-containing protein [Methanoregula sp.]